MRMARFATSALLLLVQPPPLLFSTMTTTDGPEAPIGWPDRLFGCRPTALDHMRPALDRQFNTALESAEDRVPEPQVKVGRLLETTVVKESLNQQPKEFIYDTVADHFVKRLRYDPYTSKLKEGRIHFPIPPFNNYVTNLSD